MQIHCKTCTLPKNIGCEEKNGACPDISARNCCAKSNHAIHQLCLSNAGCNVAHAALTICKRFNKFCIHWLCNSLPFPYFTLHLFNHHFSIMYLLLQETNFLLILCDFLFCVLWVQAGRWISTTRSRTKSFVARLGGDLKQLGWISSVRQSRYDSFWRKVPTVV